MILLRHSFAPASNDIWNQLLIVINYNNLRTLPTILHYTVKIADTRSVSGPKILQQKRWRPWLCHGPHWGSLRRSPSTLVKERGKSFPHLHPSQRFPRLKFLTSQHASQVNTCARGNCCCRPD